MADTTLYTTADTYVDEEDPGDNFGSNVAISVKTKSNLNIRGFLKFDLSGLPLGATISLARLRMNCVGFGNLLAGVTDIEARRVADDSWTELGVTWTNQKAYGIVEDTKVPATGWIEWNVTSFIQAEYAGDKTVSICLKSKVENYDGTARYSLYRSRDYNGDDPELYIEYTPAAEPAAVDVGIETSASRSLKLARESSVDVGIVSTADRRCVYHRYGWRP